jgi:hypothetical protein
MASKALALFPAVNPLRETESSPRAIFFGESVL